MKKIATYPRLVFILLFILIYFICIFFGVNNAILRTVFSATLAFVFAPRKKNISTQNGVKTQIAWIFLKHPIIID